MELEEVLSVDDARAPCWRRAAGDRLVAAGLEPRRREAAELAVHEALCNALEHGHRGDPAVPIGLQLLAPRTDLPRTDLPRTDLPRTDLPRTDLPRSDRLVVAVVDRALGGPWSAPPEWASKGPPSAAPPSLPTPPTGQRGHGLALIRAGCDELRIASGAGTTRVAMAFTIPRHPARDLGANGHER